MGSLVVEPGHQQGEVDCLFGWVVGMIEGSMLEGWRLFVAR